MVPVYASVKWLALKSVTSTVSVRHCMSDKERDMRIVMPCSRQCYWISCTEGSDKGVPGDYCSLAGGWFPIRAQLTH